MLRLMLLLTTILALAVAVGLLSPASEEKNPGGQADAGAACLRVMGDGGSGQPPSAAGCVLLLLLLSLRLFPPGPSSMSCSRWVIEADDDGAGACDAAGGQGSMLLRDEGELCGERED